jgi:hypothetical protein
VRFHGCFTAPTFTTFCRLACGFWPTGQAKFERTLAGAGQQATFPLGRSLTVRLTSRGRLSGSQSKLVDLAPRVACEPLWWQAPVNPSAAAA